MFSLSAHTAPRIKDPAKLDKIVQSMCQRLGRLREELGRHFSDDVETFIECALAKRGHLQPISRWGRTMTTWHAASGALADSFLEIFLVSGQEKPGWVDRDLLGVEPRTELNADQLLEFYRSVRQQNRGFSFPGDDVDANIRREHAFAVADLTTEANNEWLTVTEAADRLREVVDNISLEKAKARVSRAADAKKFVTNGKKRSKRRLDLHSFSTWLLQQRESNLDRDNPGH